MKTQLRTAKRFSRLSCLGAVAASLLLAGFTASSPAGVLAPSSLPYGYSYQEWSAKWWQWSLEQTTNHVELVGNPGICHGPGSSVRFLSGVYGFGNSVVTNHIEIPAQTPLFFSILSVWADNTGCPTYTDFTADQLAALAAGFWSLVTVTTCTIDGVAVPGLENPTNTDYLVAASPFSYTTAENGSVLGADFGEPCIPGRTTVYPAVADGVYLMLSPLAPGRHTIHFLGVAGPVSSPIISIDLTYDIRVTRDFEFERDQH